MYTNRSKHISHAYLARQNQISNPLSNEKWNRSFKLLVAFLLRPKFQSNSLFLFLRRPFQRGMEKFKEASTRAGSIARKSRSRDQKGPRSSCQGLKSGKRVRVAVYQGERRYFFEFLRVSSPWNRRRKIARER